MRGKPRAAEVREKPLYRKETSGEASYPEDLKYHPEHDWARIEGDEATFGITWYAQDALGEVVFFDPPEVGASVAKDQAYAEVESVKAVSDVFAPLSGEIVAVNEAPRRRPEKINDDPYGDGWLVKVKLSDPSELDSLLDVNAYKELLGSNVWRLMSRYTSVTDEDLQAMLDAIGVGSLEDLFADIPRAVRLGRELDLPAGQVGAGGARAPVRAGGAQPPRRRRGQLPRRGHVRPLRAVAGRHDPRALRVPHAVHALPARDLAGRAAGDVRVPDGDLGAHRPAGVERVGVRGPERGGRRRLPGEAGDRRGQARGQPRTPPALARRARAPTPPATAWRSWRCRSTDEGATDVDALAAAVDDDTAAVFVQQPNFLGTVEDLGALAEAGKRTGALLVCAADPLPLGILKPPGEVGVDICVGEGQSLGNRLDFGGPSFGFFAADGALHPQDAGPDRRRDARRGRHAAASCSRSRRASSTSAARRPRTTSAPPRR